MTKTNLFIIALLILCGIQSCKKNDSIQPIDLKTEKKTQNSSQQSALNTFQNSLPALEIDIRQFIGVEPRLEGSPSLVLTEEQAAIVLQPLINNSITLLHSYDFQDFEIIEEYGSLNDPRVAILGLTLYALEGQNSIKTCVVRALGIDILVDFVGGKYLAGYTARKLLIKAVGKAAAKLGLGGIGTALMLYEFADCMFRDGAGNIPDPGTIPGNLPDMEPDTTGLTNEPPLLLPIPLAPTIYVTTNLAAVGTGIELIPSTTVFFYNNRYYSDPSFSQRLPNGYYFYDDVYISGKYYQIVNGKIVLIGYVNHTTNP